MTAFVVLSVTPNSALDAKIKNVYPDANHSISDVITLVADNNVTAAEVCTKLDIRSGGFDHVVVVKIDSYFGHASTAIWDWLKLKGTGP